MGELFSKLMGFIADALEWAGVGLVNLFIDLINSVIVLIASVLGGMLALLPQQEMSFSPPADLVAVAAQINWFIPVPSVIACLTILALAYGGYFAIRPVLKFFQMT